MIKKHWPIILIACVALGIRIVMLRLPMSPWWDPAIYVGMGKFLFSQGTIGMWEILRPPLWPTLLGLTWIVGLNPLIMAKIFAVISGIGALIVLYWIGERERRGMGIMSALLLALSPSYAFFVAVPTNDVFSSLIILCSAYFLLSKKHFIAGILIGMSFLTRFPNGLFLLPFSLFILIEAWPQQEWKKIILFSIRKGLSLVLGFCCIAIPYFILNYGVFHDPLLPLKLGREVIEGNARASFFYYVKNIIIDIPVIVMALVGLISVGLSLWKGKKVMPVITLSILVIATVGVYFSYLGHKELRYSFGFLPFIIMLAAYGLSVLWNTFSSKKVYILVWSTVILISVTTIAIQSSIQNVSALSLERQKYYEFVPAKALTITSSPQIMLYSDAKVVGVFEAAERGIQLIDGSDGPVEYVAIDSCQVTCWSGSCDLPQQQFKATLEQSFTQVFNTVEQGQCSLSIYKKN